MSVIPLRPGQTGERAGVPSGAAGSKAGGVPGGVAGATAGAAGSMPGAASADGTGARVRLTPEAQAYLARKGGHAVLLLQPVRGCG